MKRSEEPENQVKYVLMLFFPSQNEKKISRPARCTRNNRPGWGQANISLSLAWHSKFPDPEAATGGVL